MGCGVIVKPSGDRDRYSTSKCLNINDLSTIVIPFFQQHRLYGAKWLDFQDFAEGLGFAAFLAASQPAIMGKKGHLTEEGVGKIKDLAYGMNTFRRL
jgi:hypothetical protein